jgi:serine/threonine protein kinase
MIPHADDNFDDSAPLRRWTPTAIDLVSPFDQEQDDLTSHHELAIDAPTALLQRPRFQELPPGTIVGESYEIGERLGAGSMGEVYAARHLGLSKHVAIKVICQRLSEDDRAIGRFVTEARTLAQIQHPAIVTVEHVGELPDGRAYFVMEYLRGESLSARLSRGRVFLREALRILDQMARGLAAAHASGVIHRDLKPDNTFLVHHAGEKPAIKLLDFGLAKLATTHTAITQCEEDSDEYSDSGLVFGTPLYMSPEQIRGDHLDHRSDIYALGCVAYELVLGARPFPHAQTTTAICAAHLHETPPLPQTLRPEIPPQLDRMLFAMLAKDPALRPTLAQLRSVVTDLRTSASTPSQHASTMLIGPRPTLPKKTTRHTVIMVIVAIAILTIGALLGDLVSSTIRARRPAPQSLHPVSASTLIEPVVSASVYPRGC